MINENNTVIMYDSPEAAQYRTDIKGWVSGNGRYCGDNGEQSEHMARHTGCTNKRCATQGCDNIIRKDEVRCPKCRRKMQLENYMKLKQVPYTGQPCFLFGSNQYFHDESSIEDYLEDMGPVCRPDELLLTVCSPNYLTPVDSSIWEDIFPEDSDGELPRDVAAALANLNKVIADQKHPISWSPDGKTRCTYIVNKD